MRIAVTTAERSSSGEKSSSPIALTPARQARPRRTWRSKVSSRPVSSSIRSATLRPKTSQTAGVKRRPASPAPSGSAPSPGRSAATSSARRPPRRRAETDTIARPGGVISAFCEPVVTTSIPHSSVSSGTAPRLEIASTTDSAPASRAAAASASTSLTTPVEVSRVRTNTACRAAELAAAARRDRRRRRLAPRVADHVDVEPVRGRHRRPSARRSCRPRPRRRGRRASTCLRPPTPSRRCRRPSAGRRRSPVRKTCCSRSSTCAEYGAELGRPVGDHRLGHRGETSGGTGVGPGVAGSASRSSPFTATRAVGSRAVEALLAFAAALLALRLAGALAGRWRARRRPELLAWTGSLFALRGRLGRARLGRGVRLGRRRVPRLLPRRRASLTAPLLGVGSLLLWGRRWARRSGSLYAGLAVGVALAMPVDPSVSGTPSRQAQDHLDVCPARVPRDRRELARHARRRRRRPADDPPPARSGTR